MDTIGQSSGPAEPLYPQRGPFRPPAYVFSRYRTYKDVLDRPMQEPRGARRRHRGISQLPSSHGRLPALERSYIKKTRRDAEYSSDRVRLLRLASWTEIDRYTLTARPSLSLNYLGEPDSNVSPGPACRG